MNLVNIVPVVCVLVLGFILIKFALDINKSIKNDFKENHK